MRPSYSRNIIMDRQFQVAVFTLLVFFVNEVTCLLPESSVADCKDLHINIGYLGCLSKNQCSNLTVDVKNTQNVSLAKYYVDTYSSHIPFHDLKLLRDQSLLYYACICHTKGITNIVKKGTLDISDLPHPVRDVTATVQSDLISYALNVKFRPNVGGVGQYYMTRGNSKVTYGDENKEYSAVNCTQSSVFWVCAGLLHSKVNPLYTMNYQVDALNSAGNCSSKIFTWDITYQDMYGSPTAPKVQRVNQREAYIAFSKPKRPVVGVQYRYNIQYCRKGKCKIVKTKPEGIYLLESLRPFTLYTLKIRYDFMLAEYSEWTEAVEFSTLSEVPDSKPKEIKCVSTRSGSKRGFKVTWKRPLNSFMGQVNKYLLKIGIAKVANKTARVKELNSTIHQYEISTAAKSLDVEVRACSNGGCATDSLAATVLCLLTEQIQSENKDETDVSSIAIIGGCIGGIALCIGGAAFYIYYKFHRPSDHRPPMLDFPDIVEPNPDYVNTGRIPHPYARPGRGNTGTQYAEIRLESSSCTEDSSSSNNDHPFELT